VGGLEGLEETDTPQVGRNSASSQASLGTPAAASALPCLPPCLADFKLARSTVMYASSLEEIVCLTPLYAESPPYPTSLLVPASLETLR
jgi:hypothetical protein